MEWCPIELKEQEFELIGVIFSDFFIKGKEI